MLLPIQSWSYKVISIVICDHQVCLRSCPLYHPGSIGINISSGIPRMGQLLESAWNLDEKCRFKVLPLGNEEASCSPPVIDEQDSDVPGSLGLSELLVTTFSEHAWNFMLSIFGDFEILVTTVKCKSYLGMQVHYFLLHYHSNFNFRAEKGSIIRFRWG